MTKKPKTLSQAVRQVVTCKRERDKAITSFNRMMRTAASLALEGSPGTFLLTACDTNWLPEDPRNTHVTMTYENISLKDAVARIVLKFNKKNPPEGTRMIVRGVIVLPKTDFTVDIPFRKLENLIPEQYVRK